MVVSEVPMETIQGIKRTFKLKKDRAVEPTMYLRASVQRVKTAANIECWSVSPEEYVKAAVENVETRLNKKGLRLPTRCNTPMATDYHPSQDTTYELDAEGVRVYQEFVGMLRWAIEIGRVDVLLEFTLLSSHLALPRSGHLLAVYRVFGYLKLNPRRRVYLDPSHPEISEDRFHRFDWGDFYGDIEEPIPIDMPPPRGKAMSTHCFVDADHAGDKLTRRSVTGILIFCNRAPIGWYSKRQNGVETSTFGSEFIAMKNAVEKIASLR